MRNDIDTVKVVKGFSLSDELSRLDFVVIDTNVAAGRKMNNLV
jgi:hypothetical protein